MPVELRMAAFKVEVVHQTAVKVRIIPPAGASAFSFTLRRYGTEKDFLAPFKMTGNPVLSDRGCWKIIRFDTTAVLI